MLNNNLTGIVQHTARMVRPMNSLHLKVNIVNVLTLLLQVLPYFVMEILPYPGIPGLFVSALVCGSLR